MSGFFPLSAHTARALATGRYPLQSGLGSRRLCCYFRTVYKGKLIICKSHCILITVYRLPYLIFSKERMSNIIQPSDLNPQTSTLIPQPSYLMPHTSDLIPQTSYFRPQPQSPIPPKCSDNLKIASAAILICSCASFHSRCSIASRTPGIVFTP